MNRPPSHDSSVAGAFSVLDLRIRRLVHGRSSGQQTGIGLGPGSEPDEVVRYRPGEDDVRRIDWNVTARSQQPHVWRPRPDRELDTWVLLDGSGSMSFGTTDLEKSDLAVGTAAAVGLLTDAPGNRLGFARFTGTELRWSRSRASRTGARAVLTSTPAWSGSRGSDCATSLSEAVRLFDRRQRKPGLRVLISDFIEPGGQVERPFEWEPALRRLAAGHDVLAVEVVDPRELSLPDVGAVVLQDPETGARHEVWTSRPGLREDYAALAAAHRLAVADSLRGAGAAHVVLRTDRDWVRDLARFVTLRRRLPARPSPRRNR